MRKVQKSKRLPGAVNHIECHLQRFGDHFLGCAIMSFAEALPSVLTLSNRV